MTNRAVENLALLDAETERLLATCVELTDPHRRSLCAGWDVAHVLTHVARNADALGNMVLWAVDGQERAAYSSEESRAAAIEEGARRPLSEIVADVEESARRFRERAQPLRRCRHVVHLVQDFASALEDLVGADNGTARAFRCYRPCLGGGESCGDARCIQMGSCCVCRMATLVDLGWTRLEFQSRARKQGVSGGTSGREDQHG